MIKSNVKYFLKLGLIYKFLRIGDDLEPVKETKLQLYSTMQLSLIVSGHLIGSLTICCTRLKIELV